MGEPDFTLSGLHGDGYVVEDGSTVVFYYGANELVYEIKRSDKPWKPIGEADVNRDGLKESIDLDQSQQDNGFVTLRIDDSNGKDIWSEQAGTSHVGWTSLFLCDISQECGRVIVHIPIPFLLWRAAPSMSSAVTQSSLT